MSDLGLTQECQMGYRHVEVESGIEAWRTELRRSDVLKRGRIVSVTGEPLDTMLLQFTLNET